MRDIIPDHETRDRLFRELGQISVKLDNLNENQTTMNGKVGKACERIDRLERFNDRLMTKVTTLGAIGGVIVMLVKLAWKPILSVMNGSQTH